MSVAIIPARGGSKRIPRKNIKPFCGKPMIARSIEAAIESKCFDSIMVSTDDNEIAEVAKSLGAEVPFMRPAGLADDHTGTTPVIQNAIEWIQKNDGLPDFVCCIYATAPFIDPSDILRGYELIKSSDCSYIFSATSYAFPIQRAIRILEDGSVEMFDPEQFNVRSQDLEEAFHDAGQFYWGKTSAWLDGEPIFSNARPVILPRHRVQDIDTEEDWDRAELMYKALHDL